jgi:fucose 4-O-acetylase-like acetyltransferase
MQAFVFVSGFTSKSYVRKDGKEKKLAGFLITFITFTVCIELIEFIFTQGIRPKVFVTITGAPWYMLAMFFWYLLLPLVARLRPTIALPAAVILAVVCGLFPACGEFLSLSRTIVFFPAFLAGYYFSGKWLQKIDRRSIILASAFLISVFLVLYFYRDMAKDFLKIIYAKSSYSELDISNAAGSIYRVVWLAVSAAMTFALMVIIPKRELWFTYIGSRTLSVYIVHRLIRDVLKYAGLYRFLGSNIRLLAVSVLLSVIIIYLTSSDPVFNLVNRVFRLGAMPWRKSSSAQA